MQEKHFYICDICPSTFKYKHGLLRHKKSYDHYIMSPKVAKIAPFKETLNTFISTTEDKIEEMGLDAFEKDKKGYIWMMKAFNGQDFKSRPDSQFADLKVAFEDKSVKVLAELTLKTGKNNAEITVIFFILFSIILR